MKIKYSQLLLSGAFLIGSVLATEINLLVQGSLFLIGFSLFVLSVMGIDL